MSASQTDDEDYDESVLVDEDQDVDVEARAATAEGTEPEAASYSYDAHDTVRNLSWDEDLMAEQQAAFAPSRPLPRSRRIVRPPRIALPRSGTDMTIVPALHAPDTTEVTPLLHRSTSLTFAEPPREPLLDHTIPAVEGPLSSMPVGHRPSYSSIRTADRRGSNASRLSKAAMLGKSTFGQTVRISLCLSDALELIIKYSCSIP